MLVFPEIRQSRCYVQPRVVPFRFEWRLDLAGPMWWEALLRGAVDAPRDHGMQESGVRVPSAPPGILPAGFAPAVKGFYPSHTVVDSRTVVELAPG
jgi:hypothetical protein